MSKLGIIMAVVLGLGGYLGTPVGALPILPDPTTIELTEGTTNFCCLGGSGFTAANPALGFTATAGMGFGSDSFALTFFQPGETQPLSYNVSGSDMRPTAYFDGELYFYSELQAGCCPQEGDGNLQFSGSVTGPPAAPPGTVMTLTVPWTF